MTDNEIAVAKLREHAEALRQMAAASTDHRTWRSCRDLADQLDAVARETGEPGLTARQIVARVLLAAA